MPPSELIVPVIRVYVDGDGTQYPDLQGYKGLDQPIEALDYVPKLTYREISDRFIAAQRRWAAVGPMDPVSVCNTELVKMSRSKRALYGLNNEVFREIGRRDLKPFPGVLEFMVDAAAMVEHAFGGKIKLEFVTNSSNVRAFFDGSIYKQLVDDPDFPMIDYTGQIFEEEQLEDERTVLAGAVVNFVSASKADRILSDINLGQVRKSNVIAVDDGKTAQSMFLAVAALHGVSIIVAEENEPEDYFEKHRLATEGRIDGLSLQARDWRRGRPLYTVLMGEIRKIGQRIAIHLDYRDRQAAAIAPTSIRGYHDRDEISWLDGIPSPEQTARALERTLPPPDVELKGLETAMFDAAALTAGGDLARTLQSLHKWSASAVIAPATAKVLLDGGIPDELVLQIPTEPAGPENNLSKIRDALGELGLKPTKQAQIYQRPVVDGSSSNPFSIRFVELDEVGSANLRAQIAEAESGSGPCLRVGNSAFPLMVPASVLSDDYQPRLEPTRETSLAG